MAETAVQILHSFNPHVRAGLLHLLPYCLLLIEMLLTCLSSACQQTSTTIHLKVAPKISVLDVKLPVEKLAGSAEWTLYTNNGDWYMRAVVTNGDPLAFVVSRVLFASARLLLASVTLPTRLSFLPSPPHSVLCRLGLLICSRASTWERIFDACCPHPSRTTRAPSCMLMCVGAAGTWRVCVTSNPRQLAMHAAPADGVCKLFLGHSSGCPHGRAGAGYQPTTICEALVINCGVVRTHSTHRVDNIVHASSSSCLTK